MVSWGLHMDYDTHWRPLETLAAMGYPWVARGLLMSYPWNTHRLSVGYP